MARFDLLPKMNRILDGLMGCRLEFQPVDELDSDQWKSGDLKILRESRCGQPDWPRFLEGDSGRAFGFPINLKGNFAGLAVVKGWKGDRAQQLLLLAELLTLVLEQAAQQEDRRDRLRLIEERLLLIEEHSNVIPLRPARFGRVLQLTQDQVTRHQEMEIQEPKRQSPLTSMPILIETKAGFPLHRLAVEIHQMSDRWALVGLEDLPPEVLDSRERLKELGSITLFIRDLAQLTPEQQIKLAEYLSTKPADDMPHVIAGLSTQEAEDENQPPRVMPHLMSLFCVSNLQWTEKTPEQVTSEFVSASLQHLLDRTRESVTHGEHFIPFHIQHLDSENPTVH
jgi:hypothetical protein